MTKFRTKSVTVDAFKYKVDFIPDWFTDKVTSNDIVMFPDHCEIKVAGVVVTGKVGDWIVRDPDGVIYPCNPDIFDEGKGYEPVPEGEKSADQIVDDIRKMMLIANNDGNWNYDPYLHGMANGLIAAFAVATGIEPRYLDAPTEWLSKREIQTNIPLSHMQ